ncbi:hypothetical protein CSOJ01_02985 [Colletotrichum sojae]|uniref:Uncharacterized protein n=1 Tax=Colletotrichum sojae TaxID=2175907 RepID=A0A8H6N108_9PEZI|nr:hypothetical protein CSOJ01_02985 [Colletotrichum sojae]
MTSITLWFAPRRGFDSIADSLSEAKNVAEPHFTSSLKFHEAQRLTIDQWLQYTFATAWQTSHLESRKRQSHRHTPHATPSSQRRHRLVVGCRTDIDARHHHDVEHPCLYPITTIGKDVKVKLGNTRTSLHPTSESSPRWLLNGCWRYRWRLVIVELLTISSADAQSGGATCQKAIDTTSTDSTG